jgi:O-antigen/teichoic acid export membrane protein
MLSGIFDKVKQFINIAVFIVFIPELFFTLPKNGSRAAVAAVHGILYSLCYIFLTIIFDWKNIKNCIMSSVKGGG